MANQTKKRRLQLEQEESKSNEGNLIIQLMTSTGDATGRLRRLGLASRGSKPGAWECSFKIANVSACAHTCTHVCTNMHTRACAHTHTHTHTYMHTSTHHTHTQTHIRTHTHEAQAQAPAHAHVRAHTQTHTGTCARTYTHKHCTHAHSLPAGCACCHHSGAAGDAAEQFVAK